MFHELDKELERHGPPFVRYADDVMIFCKSKRAVQGVKDSITRFMEEQLFLKVNLLPDNRSFNVKSSCCLFNRIGLMSQLQIEQKPSLSKKNAEIVCHII